MKQSSELNIPKTNQKILYTITFVYDYERNLKTILEYHRSSHANRQH